MGSPRAERNISLSDRDIKDDVCNEESKNKRIDVREGGSVVIHPNTYDTIRTRKSSFLFRHISSGSNRYRNRKETKKSKNQQQAGQVNSWEERFVQPCNGKKDNNLQSNTFKNEDQTKAVVSPTQSVQTTKSGSQGRKKRTSRFLKRALSSPPVLLQRLHSRNCSCNESNNKNSFGKDASDGTYQETDGAGVGAAINEHESVTSSDIELNPRTNELSPYTNANTTAERTKVISESLLLSNKKNNTYQQSKLHEDERMMNNNKSNKNRTSCATSILHHSYLLESICGIPAITNNNNKTICNNDPRHRYYNQEKYRPIPISEDPSVEESIECIFASQLEDGLKLWDDEEDCDDNNISNVVNSSSCNMLKQMSEKREKTASSLVSPADLQQSRMNRKDRRDSSNSILSNNMSQTKKRYEQGKIVYVGTFDPSCRTPRNIKNDDIRCNENGVDHKLPSDPLPCRCTTNFLPGVGPEDWPQAPIALRPTPGSNTRVKAIRLDNLNEPLWVPGSHLTWSHRLAQHWGEIDNEKPRTQPPHYPCCEKCVILPINNGNEKPGESLIVDFESDIFEGSLLLRLRFAEGTTPEPYDDGVGYFQNMNRRYQACIRGRFKETIPFTELVTGLRFERKFGRLPSKWILKGALKVISFFAPQMDTKIDVDRPASLSPLGSTPQCIIIDEDCNSNKNGATTDSSMNALDDIRIEPSEAHRSILGESFKGETSLLRAKMRKKIFDKLYVQKSLTPKTDPSKIYTFEFLQHLFNFQDFSIDLGNMLGSVYLEEMLNGQPLQIMAAHGDQSLWCFDVWHECLWEQARIHDAKQSSNE